MKRYCNWLIPFLSFIVLPCLAGTISPDAKIQTDSIQTAPDSRSSVFAFSLDGSQFNYVTQSTLSEYSKVISLNNDLKILPASYSDSNQFSSDKLLLLPMRASAMIFRDNLQTKPVYWLKVEFNPSDLAILSFADLRFKQYSSPWFLRSNQKLSSRLSGWKDGNSLYAANITYH